VPVPNLCNRAAASRYELPIKRASRTQPSPMGMIIHAVMAATRRQEGKLRPITRTRTLAAASTECPVLAAVIQPSPRWGVSQLPIRLAKSSATISSPDQSNARTDGSQMVHGRQTPPARAAGVTFTRPVFSSQRGWDLSQESELPVPHPCQNGRATAVKNGPSRLTRAASGLDTKVAYWRSRVERRLGCSGERERALDPALGGCSTMDNGVSRLVRRR